MEHNKGDWLPWERCEFFCEELCGRETENRDGKKRREGRSGSGVKDRSRIDEDGEARFCYHSSTSSRKFAMRLLEVPPDPDPIQALLGPHRWLQGGRFQRAPLQRLPCQVLTAPGGFERMVAGSDAPHASVCANTHTHTLPGYSRCLVCAVES